MKYLWMVLVVFIVGCTRDKSDSDTVVLTNRAGGITRFSGNTVIVNGKTLTGREAAEVLVAPIELNDNNVEGMMQFGGDGLLITHEPDNKEKK